MNARSQQKINFSFRKTFLCLWSTGIFLMCLPHLLFADPFNDKPNLTESFRQAESYFHAGDFEKARPLYQEYIDSHPRGIKASRVLYRLGQLDQANRSFSTALILEIKRFKLFK